METKTFNKSDLLQAINNEFGSIASLKKHLKDTATNEYGNYTKSIKIYGCEIIYTDNWNCFAHYLVTIPTIGCCASYALDYESRTQAGIKRGAGGHYLF